MSVEFDPDKDAANRAKHGVSLERAIELDLQTAVIRLDDRHDYGEPRWRAYGMISDRMHMLAFTMRAGVLRPISLRKANAKKRGAMADPKLKVNPMDYADVDIDDAENPEWTEQDFATARPFREVFPEFVAKMGSEQVVLTVSPATIAAFAKDGDDWKERMAAALDQVAKDRKAA